MIGGNEGIERDRLRVVNALTSTSSILHLLQTCSSYLREPNKGCPAEIVDPVKNDDKQPDM